VPTDLHLALQRYYAGEDGQIEAPVAGYLVDALRDGVAYEIQTGSFAALRGKLEALAAVGLVVLVYPVAQVKTIVQLDPETGEELSARRSPKRGRVTEVGWELLYLAEALRGENLALEVVLTTERELRQADGRGSWRRKGVSVVGRELVEVVEAHRFERPEDFLGLLPGGLGEEFTVADLAEAGKLSKALAGRLAYGLWKIRALERVGKRGKAYLYRQVKARKTRRRVAAQANT
jgi:hypothetical protein